MEHDIVNCNIYVMRLMLDRMIHIHTHVCTHARKHARTHARTPSPTFHGIVQYILITRY